MVNFNLIGFLKVVISHEYILTSHTISSSSTTPGPLVCLPIDVHEILLSDDMLISKIYWLRILHKINVHLDKGKFVFKYSITSAWPFIVKFCWQLSATLLLYMSLISHVHLLIFLFFYTLYE